MRLLSIDPGPAESAYIVLDGGMPYAFDKIPSGQLLDDIRDGWFDACDHLAIELVESFGMAVGKEVFQTVFNAGRFVEAWHAKPWSAVYRKEVKLNLCHSMRATDSNIRCAIIDRFGGKEAAVGRKKTPGPLFGISGDCWSALAVGLTWLDAQVPCNS